jgi:hypothetical protein
VRIRVVALLLFSSTAFCQTETTSEASQPDVLPAAVQAFSGAAAIPTDVRLSGTVMQDSGVREEGTFTIEGTSGGRARVELRLPSGSRTEVSSGLAEKRECKWIDFKDTTQKIPEHNCLSLGTWFLPMLALALDPESLERTPAKNGFAFKRKIAIESQAARTLFADLSQSVIVFDSASSLPRSLQFNLYDNQDMLTVIPIEIRYSDYRSAGGIKVPFHIERLMNGSKLLDLVITNVEFNVGAQAQ